MIERCFQRFYSTVTLNFDLLISKSEAIVIVLECISAASLVQIRQILCKISG